jgi:hypothetical protein
VAWTPSPEGEERWIPTRTQSLGSGSCVSGQTEAFPRWRAVRLAGDDRSSGYGLRLRLGRVGWLAVASARGRCHQSLPGVSQEVLPNVDRWRAEASMQGPATPENDTWETRAKASKGQQ